MNDCLDFFLFLSFLLFYFLIFLSLLLTTLVGLSNRVTEARFQQSGGLSCLSLLLPLGLFLGILAL